MDILLREMDNELYFSIIMEVHEGKIVRNTSKFIAETLGLDVKKYNEILIKKVIQHNSYRFDNDEIFGENDLFFYPEGISKETYVERFKEVFLKELTTFALNYQL